MIRAGLIASLLALTAPALAAPNAQLVRSVEHRLAIIGMRDVDVSTLSTAQVGALHMKLQGRYADFHQRVRTRQEVKVILGWED
ncbi:MAG: hypothetical protein AAGA08_00425 [Pseudomonadota bacterium]